MLGNPDIIVPNKEIIMKKNLVKLAFALATATTALSGCNDDAIPQTHLKATDVSFILHCRPKAGEPDVNIFSDQAGNQAKSVCRTGDDGTGLVFKMEYRRDGKDYKTEVIAETLSPQVYKIKSILFDNQPETLRSAKEIYSVLNYISNQQSSFANPAVTNKHVPYPHENSGAFSPFGRFMTRLSPKPSGQM